MPAPIIDSHCHLDFDDYKDELPDVLARARAVGIVTFVCIGAGRDLSSAHGAVGIAGREPDVFATVGIHPHDAARMTETDWTTLDDLATRERVVGIGETGLDYHYDLSERHLQQSAFRRFIALSQRTGRALVCHVRDAHADAIQILREEKASGGIIHCFTGDEADARAYLDLGFYLSFSGIVTFKNAEPIRKSAQLAPWDRILVETDSPYLAPIPFRGKRNEPAFMVKTLECLAALKSETYDRAAQMTTDNTRRAFGLPI